MSEESATSRSRSATDGTAPSGKDVDRPNILFILADDLGWGDVGYHGSPIRTPNIDRLASFGVELDQHYVCPTCTPTRASLFSGRYPSRFGRHATTPSNAPVFPDGYETLATSLRNAGYDTGLFGKWHLGSSPAYGPNQYGFAHSYGSLAGGVDPYGHHYKKGDYSRTWHRNGQLVDEQGHVTDLISTEAITWMESRDRPWFCYVPFTAVHVPVDAPMSWQDQYAAEQYDPDPRRDRSFKRYAAYASHMDHAVGRLLDSLRRTQQFDRTIIIFASDNGAIAECPLRESDLYPGWHWETPRLGSNLPLRGQKGQLYDGGIRTPAVIAWPGALEPGRCDQPIYMGDWMPTLTNLVGYTPATDPAWDGVDVWPLLTGAAADAERPAIFWNVGFEKYGLRQGDWKLITDTGTNKAELYNIAADPHEQHDLAAQRLDILERLLAAITTERAQDNTSRRPELIHAQHQPSLP